MCAFWLSAAGGANLEGGTIGSGLSKICAIGAGKLEGAKAYHNGAGEWWLQQALARGSRKRQ